MEQQYLLRLPAAGGAERIPVPEGGITGALLCDLLQTDVTERMRVPVMPDALADSAKVLCYFLDARGGDKGLPANTPGTCFYHTGCPILGDLLLCFCDQAGAAVSGFSEAQISLLTDWLHAQFPAYFSL
ncbi:MAG: hypothetical protein IJ060_03975 [Oscillospiraceae bacterium]|nr:hypothetical protein [Oscillospiraceae bacterium]